MKKSIQYKKLAKDYHNKRRHPWKDFERFLKELIKEGLEIKGTAIDLGCANGRHFDLIKNSKNRLIGIDNSIEFLKIAKKRLHANNYKIKTKNIQILQADISYLPFRTTSINCIFSIAAIHHGKTKQLRTQCFSEIYKILKKGGFFIFTVWRRWQKRFYKYFLKDWIKRKFYPSYKKKQIEKGLKEFGDIFVPWILSSEDLKIKRFYHLYSSRELKKSLNPFTIQKFEKRGGPGEKDNFFVLTFKK
jgi:SAM-dependent methyltransferase